MATETSDATTDSAEDSLDRPEFRGCAVCYSVELAVYTARRVWR